MRGGGQVLVEGNSGRDPATVILLGVAVGAGRAKVVDETIRPAIVANCADRGAVLNQRDIDDTVTGIVCAPVPGIRAHDAAANLNRPEVWFVGDIADGTGHRARSVERSLRSA